VSIDAHAFLEVGWLVRLRYLHVRRTSLDTANNLIAKYHCGCITYRGYVEFVVALHNNCAAAATHNCIEFTLLFEVVDVVFYKRVDLRKSFLKRFCWVNKKSNVLDKVFKKEFVCKMHNLMSTCAVPIEYAIHARQSIIIEKVVVLIRQVWFERTFS
jgi:hypothetical protein